MKTLKKLWQRLFPDWELEKKVLCRKMVRCPVTGCITRGEAGTGFLYKAGKRRLAYVLYTNGKRVKVSEKDIPTVFGRQA